jgi:hypothetical protein
MGTVEAKYTSTNIENKFNLNAMYYGRKKFKV